MNLTKRFAHYAFAVAAIACSASGANATTYSPANAAGAYDGTLAIDVTFTNGVTDDFASLSACVSAGVCENSWYVNPTGNGSDIPNQNASTISGFFTNHGVPGTLSQVSSMSESSLTGHTVTVTKLSPDTGADLFATHFDSQELLFEFNYLITSLTLTLGCPTSKTCDGTNDLSNIYAFDNSTFLPPPSHSEVAPLPSALLLFGGGLGLMSLTGLRRRHGRIARAA